MALDAKSVCKTSYRTDKYWYLASRYKDRCGPKSRIIRKGYDSSYPLWQSVIEFQPWTELLLHAYIAHATV